MTEKIKGVTGKLPDGTVKDFVFDLMDAKAGLKLMHESHGYLLILVELYEKTISEDDEDRLSEGEFLATVMQSIPWEKVEELAEGLLGGTYHKDLYAALYYATIANFEATINPLRVALATDESDSTGDSTAPKTEPADQK